MTRLELLRRHCLAHPPTCKRLSRLYTDDDVLRRVLADERALESALVAAARLTRDAVEGLLGPVTEGEAPPVTENDLQTVRMVALYA